MHERLEHRERSRPRDFLACLPAVHRARIVALAEEGDVQWIAKQLTPLPSELQALFLREWERLATASGKLGSVRRRESNLFIGSLGEKLPSLHPAIGVAFDATDDEVAREARLAARRATYLRGPVGAPMTVGAERALHKLLKSYDVAPPHAATIEGFVARVCDSLWWTRALRRRLQRIEDALIKEGAVHRLAAPYVSNEAMRRERQSIERIETFVDAHEVVNPETGEVVSLDDVRKCSLAEPSNRRAYMMHAVRHIERYATAGSAIGVFVTWTCPSRMHARSSKTGAPNASYDGTSVRAAQKHLAKSWNNALRELKRRGIRAFGVRVVEPHHDGTPHWHVLVFVDPKRADELVAVLRSYALADSPDEAGAREHRLRAERIDPARGDAAGYIAPYIAKNIDGREDLDDAETDRPTRDTAPRVVAWSKLWGIRQFAFFGLGSLTAFRELRRVVRVPEALSSIVGPLWTAARAKDADFEAYLRLLDKGGAAVRLVYDEHPHPRYPQEAVRRVVGVSGKQRSGDAWALSTRAELWEIRRRSDHRTPTQTMLDRVRNDAEHPSLGPASITPPVVVFPAFFTALNAPSSGKAGHQKLPPNGVRRTERRRQTERPCARREGRERL